MAPASSLTSDEVNYLVYRYLQESGFTHAAFSLAHESGVHNAGIDPAQVPAGALVTFIQKGMQYLELEANVDEGEVAHEYSLLDPRELMTKDIEELRRLAHDRREGRDRGRKAERKAARSRPVQPVQPAPQQAAPSVAAPSVASKEEPVPMEQDKPAPYQGVDFTSQEKLEGHTSEVFACVWSPREQLLASGSADSTARIWDFTGRKRPPAVMLHETSPGHKSKDVTAVEWSPDGSFLVTGAYDGIVRVFTKEGKAHMTMRGHEGPIFSLKWDQQQSMLLSGCADKKVIVWDSATGRPKQEWMLHQAAVLDVDWRDERSFASCSSDRLIHVHQLGEKEPLRTFAGHQDEVNAVRWSPSGRLLASCSDDKSAKVWSMERDKPLHDLRNNEREIYTVRWRPAGPGSANPNQRLLLGTTGFDGTVKLYDAETGGCVHALHKHNEAVYAIAFTPNGRLMATGSFDGTVHLWSVDDGRQLKSFKGDGGVFECSFDSTGSRLAASFSNKVISVMDLRMW